MSCFDCFPEDEMRKQPGSQQLVATPPILGQKDAAQFGSRLSLWQSHLRELTAEHREAEKLRQESCQLLARHGWPWMPHRTLPACEASW